MNFTQPLEIRDYPEWHKGREYYCVWVIEPDLHDLHNLIYHAQNTFKDILHLSIRRQPHITIFVNGFISETRLWDDDYLQEDFIKQQHALEKCLLQPFRLKIGGLATFTTAMYFQVNDLDEGIYSIRQALSSVSAELRWSPYVPHLTIGLYKQSIEMKKILRAINIYPEIDLTFQVKRVSLMQYSAKDLSGALSLRHTFVL